MTYKTLVIMINFINKSYYLISMVGLVNSGEFLLLQAIVTLFPCIKARFN